MQGNLSLMGNPNFWRSRTDFLDLMSWTSLCSTDPMYDTLSRRLDFAQIMVDAGDALTHPTRF